MVTSLIVLYKDCDSFAEYLFSTILGVVLSAFVVLLFLLYSAKTTQTYSITALSKIKTLLKERLYFFIKLLYNMYRKLRKGSKSYEDQ